MLLEQLKSEMVRDVVSCTAGPLAFEPIVEELVSAPRLYSIQVIKAFVRQKMIVIGAVSFATSLATTDFFVTLIVMVFELEPTTIIKPYSTIRTDVVVGTASFFAVVVGDTTSITTVIINATDYLQLAVGQAIVTACWRPMDIVHTIAARRIIGMVASCAAAIHCTEPTNLDTYHSINR